MSPAIRTLITFVLVIGAILLWGAAGVPTWYDRSTIGGFERILAVFLVVVAFALNIQRETISRTRQLPVHGPKVSAPTRGPRAKSCRH